MPSFADSSDQLQNLKKICVVFFSFIFFIHSRSVSRRHDSLHVCVGGESVSLRARQPIEGTLGESHCTLGARPGSLLYHSAELKHVLHCEHGLVFHYVAQDGEDPLSWCLTPADCSILVKVG